MANIKSVLIIGGSGFLGTNLALKLREGYKVFATYNKHPTNIPGVSCIPFDVENRKWIKRVIYIVQPDVVLYLVGRNDLEWAEKNPRLAERLHGEGTATIVNSFDILQPRFIFFSNPYVFDGSRGNYRETDILVPRTLLGRMKSAGENTVKSKCLNYVIVRSSPVFGRSSGNNLSYLDRLRMALDRGQRWDTSTQELHSHTTVQGLANLIYGLIESGIRNRTVHYGGLTKINEFEFAKQFAKRFGYDPSLIVARGGISKKSDDEDAPILSTFDFTLNSSQATEILKIKPFLLEESFDLIEKQLISYS
jgi:dTDP-4-dehydrorhamnose reductase